MNALNSESSNKSNYVRYISHEIRSPISTITLGIDLTIATLKDIRHPKAGMAVDMLRDINMSCDIAIASINNLLDFDKLKNSMMDLQFKVVFGCDFVRRCLKPFHIQAQSSGIALTYKILDERQRRYCINVDGFRFEQVIRNLVSNALKFSKPGDKVAVIMKFYQQMEGNSNIITGGSGIFRVEVTDEGPGMTEDQISRLFGKYVQFNANELQQGQGSGLGLWLSKMIVEMHKGKIGVTSEGPGKGSTFFVELPCTVCNLDNIPQKSQAFQDIFGNVNGSKDDTELSGYSSSMMSMSNLNSSTDYGTQQPQQPQQQHHLQETLMSPKQSNSDISIDSNTLISSQRKYNFLVCDDSNLSRKMFIRALGPYANFCDQACDGVEICDMISIDMVTKEKCYDVILIDLYMPRMCGPDAVAQIRNKGFKGVIIGVSGATDSDAVRFLKCGANHIISKPVHFKNLMKVIRESVDNMSSPV